MFTWNPKYFPCCYVQLSKIIKHLQAQLDCQEAVGARLEGQLATTQGELERLQAMEAKQQETIEQVCSLALCMLRQEPCQEHAVGQLSALQPDRNVLHAFCVCCRIGAGSALSFYVQ